MARKLLKMATDDNVADSLKLTAIRDALVRGGVIAKTSVEIGLAVQPYEQILGKLEGGSREDFLRFQRRKLCQIRQAAGQRVGGGDGNFIADALRSAWMYVD